jgi:TatD DNase family protein
VLIDTHCHLADTAFARDLDAVVGRARDAGVTSALCILSADESDEVARAATVRAAWPEVRFAAGVHPHRAAHWNGRLDELTALIADRTTGDDVIAVGEIGLDYYYDFAPKDVQQQVFAAQVELAASRSLPVVIHARESLDDTLAILRAAGAGDRVRGVMHCFTGTLDEARRALDIGFYVSMSGIVTFPKSAALREVAAFVPPDRLVIETDAPFLAPVPNRGKRNEPAWVAHTAAFLAELRGTTTGELAATLRRNVAALLPALVPAGVR